MPPEEAALWSDFATGSLRAREALVALYLPFARKLARRHYRDRSGGDIEFPDLFQYACAGLLEAVDRFDPARGAAFRGYAARRISGSIVDGISKASELREQISFRNRVRRERARSLVTQDEPPATAEDPLQALSDLAVGLALGFMLEDTSLLRAEEALDPAPNAYDSLAWKELVARALSEIARLPEREETLIRRHYLEGMAFDQIAILFGVSKGRVSQLHRAAIARLRDALSPTAGFHLER